MEKENIILQYIAVWNWFVISIIFLVSAFITVFSGNSLGNDVMFVAFILAWVVCIIIAMRRKGRLDTENYFAEQEIEPREEMEVN